MNRFSRKFILILALILAATIALFHRDYVVSVIILLVIISDVYMVWEREKNQDDLDAMLKNLKSFKVTGRTQKLLIQDDSKHSELIIEINNVLDAYDKLRIDKQLQASNSKQLLSNLSHDIRTPLTSIIGYVDALNDGIITTEEEMKEFLGILSMKSKNLKELTDQIFNVARIDADDVVLNFEYIELNEFLRNIIIDFVPMLEKHNLELANGIPDERYMVYGDRVALTRIFQNIIKNSIQHGKEGKVLGVKCYIANDYYRVIIWDKGKGIPKSKQKYIFERLFRVDDSRKLSGSNSGLGMAIAKKLTQKHEGNIFLKSEENELTEFFIELPILKELKI